MLAQEAAGPLWTAGLLVVLGLSARRVVRRGFGGNGLAGVLGAAVLAWAWATLGLLALGSLGLVSRGGLLGWAALGGVLSLPLGRAGRAGTRPVVAERRWEWSASLALAVVLWAAAIFGAIGLLGPVRVASDGPIYHLYFAARWWKAGRIFLIPVEFGETAATYFPAVGELDFTWLMTAWGGDRLAKVGQLPFLGLAALAVFGLARRLGAGTPAATIATCWFVTSSPFFVFSFEPNVDTIFVAGYLAAVFFAVRYALGDDGGPALFFAGLAAGGAWGSKPTGTVFVPPLLAGIAAIILSRRSSGRRRLGHLGLLLVGPALLAAPWFARNAWLTGNPLYPLQVEAFGRVVWRGWYDSRAMRVSVYYLPRDDGRSFLGLLGQVFDPRLAPLWVLGLLGAWRIGRRGRREDRWAWALAGLSVLNIGLYWGLIPYRTQQRFMFHAAGLAAVPLALWLDRGRPLRWVATGLLVLHVTTGQGWLPGVDLGETLRRSRPPGRPEIPIMPALLNLRTGSDALSILVAITPGLGALAVAWAWGRAVQAPAPKRISLAGVLAIGFLAAVGFLVDQATRASAYRDFPPFQDFFRGWNALDRAVGPRGARVAYAGTNIPYYLLGKGLRNDVRYVNVDLHRGWLMHDYHRALGRPNWPDARPGWDRLHPDYDAWLANLRADRIDFLVVTRANPGEGRHLPDPADPLGFPIERRWAESHPDVFEPVYGVAENDPRFRVFRIRYTGRGPG